MVHNARKKRHIEKRHIERGHKTVRKRGTKNKYSGVKTKEDTKQLLANCVWLSGRMHVCMYGHTNSKSKDQQGKVANPARGQLLKNKIERLNEGPRVE